jgi:hypothetical protein
LSRTSNLKRQHDAAIDLVGQITEASKAPPSPEGAYRIAVLLAKLTGMLRIHFVQEDKTLYPYMLGSTNAAAAQTARAFRDEMGGLGTAFDTFAKRWSSSHAIARDFDRFRRESVDVFDALGERIKRENEQLYPLADSIQLSEVPRTA